MYLYRGSYESIFGFFRKILDGKKGGFYESYRRWDFFNSLLKDSILQKMFFQQSCDLLRGLYEEDVSGILDAGQP